MKKNIVTFILVVLINLLTVCQIITISKIVALEKKLESVNNFQWVQEERLCDLERRREYELSLEFIDE